jgi:hypothetical protein
MVTLWRCIMIELPTSTRHWLAGRGRRRSKPRALSQPLGKTAYHRVIYSPPRCPEPFALFSSQVQRDDAAGAPPTSDLRTCAGGRCPGARVSYIVRVRVLHEATPSFPSSRFEYSNGWGASKAHGRKDAAKREIIQHSEPGAFNDAIAATGPIGCGSLIWSLNRSGDCVMVRSPDQLWCACR